MPIILDGTAGLTNNATDLNYTGTLTGGTGVVNLGSGQVVKDASGNVGIGTSSPGAKLDVNGGVNSEMRVSTSGAGYLQVGQFTNGAFIGTSSTDATAGVLRLGTGGTTRATIDSSGQLKTMVTGGTAVMDAYAARAWVTFNGTGTVAIRASGNVSSITRNGTGDYTVNFTTAMPDINYCTTGACQRENLSLDAVFGIYANDSTGASVNPTTTQARVTMSNLSNGSIDSAFVCVAIFR